MPDTTGTTTTEAALGLAPWVESIQAIKDDVDESRHVLTVFAVAALHGLVRVNDLPTVDFENVPFSFHAFEVLQHYGLVTLTMNEAPDIFNVAITTRGRQLLAQAQADRYADLADREGRLR